MAEGASQAVAAVSPKVILARHMVGVALLMILQSPRAYAGSSGFLETWLMGTLIVFAAAAVVTALAWLFFTKRESGKTGKTFAMTSWVLAVLLLVGQWVV